jgi:pyruvate kinase
MPKRTKIIATVGPATVSADKLRALVNAGVNVFRINFSHGDEQQRDEMLRNIRAVEAELGCPVAVCGDLCGPKIRTGVIHNGQILLQTGQSIVIQRETVEGTAERISTTFPELIDVVNVGEKVLLSDGRLRFEVVATSPPEHVTCRVVVGGTLSSGKGINVPETRVSISPLTEKDRQDVAWIGDRDFDYVALSFVQRPEDVVELRELLAFHGSAAHIIAKIEKPQALHSIDEIIAVSDAVMVARGDLGVEMEFPSVPIAQKTITDKCAKTGTPCIIATEMLESMIAKPTPTRAEVSDIANAVFDRADAVMLSAETAIGDYPVEAVTAMSQTVAAAEAYVESHNPQPLVEFREPPTTASLARAVRGVMKAETIAAVASFTFSGTTARLISKSRPACPIVSMSTSGEIVRRCCLYYGVIPRLVESPKDAATLLRESVDLCRSLGVASQGDRLIILTAEPIGATDETNGLVMHTVN